MSQRSDQASDRVSYTASAPPAPATAFTVTLWARLRVDRDDFSTMMRLHSSAGGSTTVNITTGSSGTTPVVVSPGNTGGIVGTDALAVDTWRMVAVTVAGTGASDGKIYTRTIGGSTNVVTGEVSGGATPDGLTLFGRSAGDSGEWFNGGLAYVRVWSAVLSQAEIEAEWASATIVRTSGVWANWPMVADINDVSGNGRNLTAGTTALSTEDDPPLSSSITGSALGAFGGLGATAVGVRTVNGSAAGAFGALTGAAAGTRTVRGTAGATFGGLIATASDGAPDAPEQEAAPAQGSWYGLLDILREGAQQYREERERTPEACGDCGEPLRTGPRGELYCRFDGSVWAAGGRRVGHVDSLLTGGW
ncbi:LamG-like jellyroll fold domain-containing protein [Streptomyces lasiicapitis]|uniref:LamG-like jellyroll fold domain-containing protein n=1 Tax=Streptomyces lasiicapitis TaxID=1923961 RepID=UPI00364C2623